VTPNSSHVVNLGELAVDLHTPVCDLTAGSCWWAGRRSV